MIAGIVIVLAFAQTVNADALARKAIDDFRAGRYGDARQGFLIVLKSAPNNAGVWAYLGLTEGELNNVPAAITDLEKARSLAPDDPQILFNLGLFYAKTGNREKAREAYRQGLKQQPDDFGANQNYALLLLQDRKFEDAIAPLKYLHNLQPANRAVAVTLIECLYKSGQITDARNEIQSLLDSPGATLDDSLKASSALVDNGAPAAAEILLTTVAARFPDSAEVHAGLGRLLLDRAEYEAAVRELGRAAQLMPDVAGYSLGLAEALLLWKHYTTALQLLQAVEPKFGTLPDFRYKLGLAWYGLYRYRQAMTQFDAVIKDRPSADSAWYFLGNSWLAMGKLDDAEHAYHEAIRINPSVASYYTALGELLRRSEADRVLEAVAALQEALRLDPADYLSCKDLALCHERLGDLAKAVALLDQVTREHPDFKEAHVAYARVCYKLHRKEDGDRERQIVAHLEAEERAKQSAIRTAAPAR